MAMVAQRNSYLKKPLSLLISFCFILIFSGCSLNGTTKPLILSGRDAYDSLPKQPLLIHFWSSWCRLCLSELSAINSLNEYADTNGVKLITVAVNDSLPAVMKVHRAKLQNTIVILDDGSLEKMFNIPAVPYTVAVDKDRKIIPIPFYPSGRLVNGIDGLQPWGSIWGERVINAIHLRIN